MMDSSLDMFHKDTLLLLYWSPGRTPWKENPAQSSARRGAHGSQSHVSFIQHLRTHPTIWCEPPQRLCGQAGWPEVKGILHSTPTEPAQIWAPRKFTPVAKEEIVPCGKVNQVTKIISVEPPDLGNKVTPNKWKPDLSLLTGGQTRPFGLPPVISPLPD